MFKAPWQYGRAIRFAESRFEGKKAGGRRQPGFIPPADGQPAWMAAIGSKRGDEAPDLFIVTSEAETGLADIHERRPLRPASEPVGY
ncbi:TPA: hypothetical protein JG904_002682 [Enterobacter hormaechei subsp. xiangfangensis]|nr:hypothetical protein [Enterobacter hormaechei subsp. xiangfangensis]